MDHLVYFELTRSGNLCFYGVDLDGDMIFALLDVDGHYRDTNWAPLCAAVYSENWRKSQTVAF